MNNEIIKLDNRNFLIIERVKYQEENYLYVIATDGSNDITILNEFEENNKKYVKSITDKYLINEIFLLISNKYKEV